MKRQTPIPEFKKKAVNELSNLIKNKKTILIASIKNLPGSQFQEISKKLRGKAIVKVPKKSLIFRAIDSSSNAAVKELKEQIGDSVAVLFSDLDSYELASELLKSKTPAKAKAGQIAPYDIEVEAGGTDLVPGPAISELGSLGIQIEIKEGKIHIKEPRVIAKEGTPIKQNAAEMMAKLDIKPFSIGFIPLCAFDLEQGKLYLDIKIDKEEALNELKTAYSKAFAFAVEIGYTTPETVKFMIGKAGAQANKINRIMTGEPEEVEPAAQEEEKKEDAQEKPKKEEPKQDAAAGLASLFG